MRDIALIQKFQARLLRRRLSREEKKENARLRSLPRYVSATTTLWGRPLHLVDARSYLGGKKEIFEGQVYEFPADRVSPYIIDCGANIGLSVIYFKTRYPDARIAAFEPDPKIFKALQANVLSFGFSDVDLHHAAVWTQDGEIEFQAEGGFSGRINPGAAKTVRVPATRLKNLLCEKVDFLKLDIEGAETDVLTDCAERLGCVESLFVEYHSEGGKPQRLDVLLKIIRESGFRYQIREAYAASKPYFRQPLMMGMDLQLNIFCFRKVTP